MSKFAELKFFRVIDPGFFRFIPKYLFEQIKDINPEAVDTIKIHGASILTTLIVQQGQLMRIPNALVHLAVLHNIRDEIKGFLWAEIDIVDKRIFVQAYSVDKKYQGNGEAIQAAVDYLFNLPIEEKFKQKIAMATTRTKAFEKKGWKRSEKILMEISNEQDKTPSE